ncbi:MAG: acyltransferase, partial [Clostridiales bacterium]|nr:acyltransferase [Clostridiales bacterium]
LYYNIHTPAEIPLSFVKRLILADSAPMMYYVFVYIQFTLLIPTIGKISKSKFIYLPFLITPLEIIFVRLLPMLLKLELNSVFLKVKSISCLPWFTFFYLGYLLGNNIIKIKASARKLTFCFACSIILQIFEGYAYYLVEKK